MRQSPHRRLLRIPEARCQCSLQGGNDPLPAGVIAATQHRHLAQFVRCVTVAFAPATAWISGHADEWHADVWRKAGTRLRRLIGTRGLHGVLIEQSELPGTQGQRAYRVVVERVFRNRAFELVFSGSMS